MSKGERIRDLRKAKGITQIEMAKLLSTTKQTISKYENGIVTNIPSDRVEAIATILETTPEYILGWEAMEEKPAMFSYDGLTENQKKLIDFARTVPEDKAAMILKVIQSIVEDA